jgi:TetR/AcrR family transcriptional regulator, ethionamide resistance regulator
MAPRTTVPVVDDDSPRARWRAHTGKSAPEIAVFAATEQLLATQPLHEISVEAILDRSGISRAAFYYYFSSKYDVVANLAAAALEEIIHHLDAWTGDHDASPSEVLRSSLQSGIKLWVDHGLLLAATIENMHSAPELGAVWIQHLERLTSLIAREIDRERADGTAPDGVPAEAVAGVLVWASERLLYLGLRGVDDALPSVEAAGDALLSLWSAAIYGSADHAGRRP